MNTTPRPRPTPETDAEIKTTDYLTGEPVVVADFARKLERERDEARKHLAAANKGAEINAHINHSLAAKLAEAKRERDEMREYAERLKEGCIKLSFAIDRIDYACGNPNEMEVSDYALHQNEEHVVQRVKEKLEAMREAIKEAISALQTSTFVMQHSFPSPAHEGVCGPESCCDASCMEAASLARILERNNAALAKLQPFIKTLNPQPK